MKNVKLTLEERVALLEKQMSNMVGSKEVTKEFTLNVDNFKSNGELKGVEFLNYVKSLSEEFEDEHKNIYVDLPTIYVSVTNKIIHFSFDEVAGYIKLQPQKVSKYKNSLVDGKIRSIPDVAPNFSQFSFNKATKFCKWVDGEQLNWKTVLYIQIMWAYAYGTKNNNDILPNEKYNWNTERDCAFGDTGRGVGEFLGIEQLFTSGRNFVDISGIYCIDDALWRLYKKWNFSQNFDPNNKFAVWGDYDPGANSYAPFFSTWYSGFRDCWNYDISAVRLCKRP